MSVTNKSGKAQSTIARFDPIERSWSKLGDLNVSRYGHGVIQVDSYFIVVGGSRNNNIGDDIDCSTELCRLNEQSMICTTRKPELTKFTLYSEVMLIL